MERGSRQSAEPPARTRLGVDRAVHQQRLWEEAGRRWEVSSISSRRQRPAAGTGWIRTCGEARIDGVRTPGPQRALGENGRAVGSIPLGGTPLVPLLSLQHWRAHKPLGGEGGPRDPLLAGQSLRRGPRRPACPVPTCSVAAGFLGPLRGGLAAAEGVRVTDVLALELGGRGASGIGAGRLGFQPPGETDRRRDWGSDVATRGAGTWLPLAPGESGNGPLSPTQDPALRERRPRPSAQDALVQGQPASTASHEGGGVWGWHGGALTSGGPGAGRCTSRGCW